MWADGTVARFEEEDRMVGVVNAVSRRRQSRSVLAFIAPGAVLELAYKILVQVNELLADADRLIGEDRTPEMESEWQNARRRLTSSSASLMTIAKMDLGLILDGSKHEENLEPAAGLLN
jgi:hypothetical protein